MRNHYEAGISMIDTCIRILLKEQCMDPNNEIYGAREQLDKGTTGGHSGLSLVQQYIEAYYTPQSSYFRDEIILDRAVLAMEFAISRQWDDGTLDLLETNFHDPAETAFSMHNLGPAFMILRKLSAHTEKEDHLEALMYQFTDLAANGMIYGGFHTPNHRWVLSAALAFCYALTQREDCLEHIRVFLDEGIDCDENGEYTERSAGGYNVICNRSLMILAKELDMPQLYDYIHRNLMMMLCYMEPDGRICTLNSTRQDRGTDPRWTIYYENYLYLALLTKDKEMAGIADEMLDEVMEELKHGGYRRLDYYSQFYSFLLYPELIERQHTLESAFSSRNAYNKYFKGSGVVRWRKEDLTLTLMRDKTSFLKVQHGTHDVYVRMAGSFFGKGQFQAGSIEEASDGYLMRFCTSAGYIRPLGKDARTSDWRAMDHSGREVVGVQEFETELLVSLVQNGLELSLNTRGCDMVPIKLELLMDPGGRYITDSVEFFTRPGQYVYQKAEMARYQLGDYGSVGIEGGFYAHYSGDHMRGSIPADEHAFTVTMTGYTPVKETVKIIFK